MKFLLGQLGNNGDCLYATIVARQIKHDYPDSHLTWAIARKCRTIPVNNPYVDDIWVIPPVKGDDMPAMSRLFLQQALIRKQSGEFDRVVYTQIWPDNFRNYDGTIRASVIRNYGAPITVPIENVLNLTDEELENVSRFVSAQKLMDYDHRIIFECASNSGQSFVTPAIAHLVAACVYELLPNACIIMSCQNNVPSPDPRTKWAGVLSLREIAALTRAGTLFVGCGSGCTVAATSTAAVELPMIQLLEGSTGVYASFAHDFEHFGKPSDHILEMTDTRPEKIADAIVAACTRGIAAAKAEFHVRLEQDFAFYAQLINTNLLGGGQFIDAAQSAMVTAARYGWQPGLIQFARDLILPHLQNDAQWHMESGRTTALEFANQLQAAIQAA